MTTLTQQSKKILKDLVPPILIKSARTFITPKSIFSGNYSSYENALAACSDAAGDGYLSDTIIEKTFSELKEQEALAKQTVCNSRIQQLLSSFFIPFENRQDRNIFKVLDFGGGLGAYYVLAKPFFPKNVKLDWNVVETDAMVNFAKKNISFNELSFFTDLKKVEHQSFDVVFASGVFPYVPNPEKALEDLAKLNVSHYIISRIPMISGNTDRLTVQKNPREIYATDHEIKYPAWFFSKAKWEELFSKNFTIKMKWSIPEDSHYLDDEHIIFSGYCLEKKL